MDVLKTFANKDTTAMEEGKWFVLGLDAKIKMRSLTSQVSKTYRRKAMEPYTHLINANKSLPEGTEEQITKDQLTDVIILDWEGLTANDEPLPYNKENCRMLLEEAEDFVDVLVQILMGDASFKADKIEEESKN